MLGPRPASKARTQHAADPAAQGSACRLVAQGDGRAAIGQPQRLRAERPRAPAGVGDQPVGAANHLDRPWLGAGGHAVGVRRRTADVHHHLDVAACQSLVAGIGRLGGRGGLAGLVRGAGGDDAGAVALLSPLETGQPAIRESEESQSRLQPVGGGQHRVGDLAAALLQPVLQ